MSGAADGDAAAAAFTRTPVKVCVAERVATHDGLHVLAKVEAPELLAQPAYVVMDMTTGRLSLANQEGQHAYVDLADLILKLARVAGHGNAAGSRLN